MTSSISPIVLKSLIATGVVYVIDQKVLKDADMMGSAYYAVSSGVGIYVGSSFGATVAGYVPSVPPAYTTIAERISEVGLGVGTAYAINKFLVKNDAYGTSAGRAGAVIFSDIVSTLIVEYLNGQPLMIL